MDPPPKIPTLIASTSDIYQCSIAESRNRERALQDVETEHSPPCAVRNRIEDEYEFNYFKSSQWSPDGTTLITSSADNSLRTFILPPDLLSSSSPTGLKPYTTHTSPTSINCFAPYPHFSLQDTSTTVYLSTPTDLPIRLTNCLSASTTPLSTYSLISPTTEAYLTPSTLLWSTPGTHFLTGTDCLIALFDVSRSGEGPVTRMPTIPSKRHKLKGGGIGMRGIVSSLSLQPSSPEHGDGMLAAGTWTRWIGLYDMGGLGGLVSTWSISDAADKYANIGGMGITETKWSSCGRYLLVVERKSSGVLVYDVRVMGKLIGWLEGREADTNQRLGVDVFEAEGGTEVWAGGTDGIVRIWEGVGKTEGAQERSWEWRAHDDPVSSTVVHSSGTVVATSSGQRAGPDFKDGDSSTERSESSDNETEEVVSTISSEDSDGDNSSTYSVKPAGRKPDNSIKVWRL